MMWQKRRRTVALWSGLTILVVVVIIAVSVQIMAPALNRDDAAARARGASQLTTGALSRPTATATATPNPIPGGNDWPQYRFDVAGTGVNPEGEIRSTTVGQLQPAWVVTNVWGYHPFESTPAVMDGIVYVTSGHSLHAIDLVTGHELWHFDDSGPENGTIFSSVAVDRDTGLAIYGTPGGRVYAVNIKSHASAWMVQLGDPAQGAVIWSSPLVVNGKVYIGFASNDDNPCVRGNVTAIDAATGHVAWTHYMAPQGELGGAVWSSVTADVAAHEIIATTGNPCDFSTGTSPQGGSVDAEQDAIVALDWNTGGTAWIYSAEQDDECDCDFGEGAAVFTFQQTKYVVAGNKAGVVYALVPPTTPGGSPTVAWQQTISGPGDLGTGGIFQPPTYSDGLVFIAGGPTPDSACAQGALWAFHADTGATAWRICTPNQLVGASTVSDDTLLMGMQDELVALSTTSGAVLWQAAEKPGTAWGGTTVSHGFVLSPMVGGPNNNSGQLFCYRLPAGTG
jgi:outer membrane protein assembly factor BamB